jgi:hypothetical protein
LMCPEDRLRGLAVDRQRETTKTAARRPDSPSDTVSETTRARHRSCLEHDMLGTLDGASGHPNCR